MSTKDRLSRLPPELLKMVFDELEGDISPLTTAMPRVYLPYVRQNLYNRITISNLRSFELLRATVEENTYFAVLVTSLTFSLIRQNELPVIQKPSFRSVLPFFDCVANVEFISIEGDIGTQLADYILSARAADRVLRRMTTLSLNNIYARIWPYHFSHYQNLKLYPNLEKFSIKANIEMMESYSTDSYVRLGLGSNTNIKTLEMGGNDGWEEDMVADFLSHFASLTVLQLATAAPFDLSRGLTQLTRSIQHLHLQNCWRDYDRYASVIEIDSVISQFSQLQTLELWAGSYTSEIYLELLKCKKLRKIIFQDDSLHTLRDFKMLFLGNDRLSELEELEIRMYDTGRPGRAHQNPLSQVDFPDSGWEAPTWPEEMSYQDAKELRLFGEQVGVAITGSLLRAIEV